MIISEYAKANYFQINKDDDDYVILNKRFLLERDRITRQIHSEQRRDEFLNKYNKIMSMRSQTTLEKLKIQLAVEELLDT